MINKLSPDYLEMFERLRERWYKFWQEALGSNHLPTAPYSFAELVADYQEMHRKYHTLQHIDEGLEELDSCQHLSQNLLALKLAWWNHDRVYDTTATDNERRSVQKMRRRCKYWGFPKTLPLQAANLVLITTTHEAPQDDADGKLIIDIDLSILGKPRERYDEYEEQIRLEYEWVPEDTFLQKRGEIMRGFLNRPQIYNTIFFRKKYEQQARANIARFWA